MNTIILLGLPKSGTTSLGYFFSKLGYKNIHHISENNKFIGNTIDFS